MTWNCTNTEERLSDYIDGLMTPAEAEAFKAHAATCADCANMVAAVSSLVTNMHALELEPAPPMLINRILDATSGPRKEKASWKSWFTMPGRWVQPRFVLGLATVAATILIVVYTSGFTPSKLLTSCVCAVARSIRYTPKISESPFCQVSVYAR